EVYERLKRIAGSRVTGGGELLITARRFRTQDANRSDARVRLAEMIAAPISPPSSARRRGRARPRRPGESKSSASAAASNRRVERSRSIDVRFQDRGGRLRHNVP